jgi:OPA family glycerol-3-phosphate transporter-like MFS transporter
LLIKDSPSDAGFEDFDTHDASSGEMHETFTAKDLIKRVLGSPLMMIFAAIEFTSGVLRNGIMQWYHIFAKAHPESTSTFFQSNWGFLLCIFGIFGGFAGGLISDKIFQSRRGPPAAIAQGLIFICAVTLAIFLFRDTPTVVALSCLFITAFVITTHSLMSGTAAADFGGRKATATASGFLDACVYLGSGLQSFAIGALVNTSWSYWPIFLAPFALIGCGLAIWVWHELPEATKRYLIQVAQISVLKTSHGTVVRKSQTDIEVTTNN